MDLSEQSLVTWELHQSATALQEAEKLMQNREFYFEMLYEDVRYFAYSYDVEPTAGENPSVEYQALKIIDSKRVYNKRIEKLKDKFIRWRAFLKHFSKSEADLLQRYFEEGDSIPRETIDRLLIKVKRVLIASENAREKVLDDVAKEEYREYRKRNQEKLRAKLPVNVGKKQYLINGRFIYMSEEEYADHIQGQQDRRDEIFLYFKENSIVAN